MQGWFLVNGANFWGPAQTEAFLGGIPSQNLLMLDLVRKTILIFQVLNVCSGRKSSQYGKKLTAFTAIISYGKQLFSHFTLLTAHRCMLHNFGGRTGMYGILPTIASQPAAAASANKNMVGMGLTPEAIETYFPKISTANPI